MAGRIHLKRHGAGRQSVVPWTLDNELAEPALTTPESRRAKG